MATPFNIDNLRKADLDFEIRIRGGTHQNNVSNMRKVLRQLMAQNKELSDSCCNDFDIEAELELCKNIIQVLANDLENLEDTSAMNDLARFRDRLYCFTKRAELLKNSCTGDNDKYLAEFESLISSAKNFDVSYKAIVGSSSLKRPLSDPSALTGSESNLNLPCPSPGSLNNRCDPITVNTVQVNKANNEDNHPVQNVPDYNTQTGAGILPYPYFPTQPSTSYVPYPVRNTQLYGRLPHPAEKLLNMVPKTDGFCVDSLLKFFKMSLKLRRSFPELEPQLLSMLSPYTSGPLNACLLRHIDTNNFENFHREAIKFFIPSKQFYNLKQNLFLRCQGSNEKLSSFIGDIKEASEVLQLQISEREICETIIEGLSPTVRSCCVFLSPPTNFVELDRLCIQTLNVQFTDAQRGSSEGAVSKRVDYRPAFNPGKSNPVICHHCKKPGHIKPRCPELKPSTNPKNL